MTELQASLAWYQMGNKRMEYEASNDSRSKEQELKLMEALRKYFTRDDSAIAQAKRNDADHCFVSSMLNRVSIPVLVECIKTIRR